VFVYARAKLASCTGPSRPPRSHFPRSYGLLLIKTCHRREIHAMGGMAAHIPIRDDPAANETAMEKVRSDKLREAGDGHDATWVAHPGLVGIAKEIFGREMQQPNQIARKRQDAHVTAADLLAVPTGSRTRTIDIALCRAVLDEPSWGRRPAKPTGNDAARMRRHCSAL
jgi:malate synthase A